MARLHVIIADPGVLLQRPADIRHRLGPEDPLQGPRPGEFPLAAESRQGRLLSVGIHPDQDGRKVHARFFRVHGAIAGHGAGIDRIGPGQAHLRLRPGERTATAVVLGPKRPVGAHHLAPGDRQFLAGGLLGGRIHRREGAAQGGGHLQEFRRIIRVFVQVPVAGDGQVAQPVDVRRVLLDGPVAPLVPAAEVAGVEVHPHLAQEVAAAAAAGLRQGRFGHHGVTLQQRGVRHHADNHFRQFAEGIVEACPEAGPEELLLRDVPALVDGEELRPGNRGHPGHVRQGEQVHPPGRPGDEAVGNARIGVQDDGHRPGELLVRPEAGRGRKRDAVLLQQRPVNGGQRVEPAGIDQLIVSGPERGPAEAPRVIARGGEQLDLRVGAKGQNGGHEGRHDVTFHRFKACGRRRK